RIARDRSESGGGRAWEVVTRFRFSDNGNAGDEAHERRGSADRGFEHVQGVHNGDGHGNSAPGRPAGTALASERSRMAVLHRGQSKNDGGGHREQSANDGFPGGRRGIRGKNFAALHREYRRYGPNLPGDVQEQLLSRLVVFGVVSPHPTGAGDGTSQYRPGDAGCDTERWVGGCTGIESEMRGLSSYTVNSL